MPERLEKGQYRPEISVPSSARVNDVHAIDALLIGLIGGAVIAAAFANAVLSRSRIPPLVGYVAIGLALRVIDLRFPFLTEQVTQAFRLLADLGIVALLFGIGLESHPSALAARLPDAAVIWISNMMLAFMAGFGAAFWLLDVGLLPALVIGTALSATSVGVAIGVWKSAGALDSPNGNLLVDVAELDDVSAIALMAVLFAIAPILATGGDIAASAINTLGAFIVRLALFLVVCFVFAQFVERRVTAFSSRLPEPPQRMLVVAGVGFLIASLAGVMGFSLAIGALAAGLVFSHDPDAVKTEASFTDISSFVTPFFFIGIGLQIEPGSLTEALIPGLLLTLAAIVGKVLGTYLSARFVVGASGAALLAISMVPRAEIAMVVMDQGRTLMDGDGWLYSAMVIVTAVTSLGAPLALGPLLKRWPQR